MPVLILCFHNPGWPDNFYRERLKILKLLVQLIFSAASITFLYMTSSKPSFLKQQSQISYYCKPPPHIYSLILGDTVPYSNGSEYLCLRLCESTEVREACRRKKSFFTWTEVTGECCCHNWKPIFICSSAGGGRPWCVSARVEEMHGVQ